MEAVPPLHDFLDSIPPLCRHRLDEKFDDSRTRARIARSLGSNWKMLAQYLPNIEDDIDCIEYDNRTLDLQKIALLQKWLDRNGRLATYRQLARCLYEAGAINSLDVLCKELAAAEPHHHLPETPSTSDVLGSEGAALQHIGLRQRQKSTSSRSSNQQSQTQNWPLKKTLFTLVATASILAVLAGLGIYCMLPVHVPSIYRVSPGLVSNDENLNLPPDSFHFEDENRQQYA